MVAAAFSQREIKSAPRTAVYRRRQPLDTSNGISANIWRVASWLMALPGHAAPVAVTISSSRSPVKGAVFVPPAIPVGWWRLSPIWLFKSFRWSRCGSGCCLSPNGCSSLVHLSENGLKTYHVRPKIPRWLSLHPQIPRAQI